MTARDSPLLPYLLISYGIGMSAAGILLLVSPAFVKRTGIDTTASLTSHVLQSTGASALGLSVTALATFFHGAGTDSVILLVFALSGALSTALVLLTQLPSSTKKGWRWINVAVCLMWTVGFWWVAASHSSASMKPTTGFAWTSRQMVLGSFALWTGITGLLWLMAPGPLAALIEESLGQGSARVATARGVVDIPMGVLAWVVVHQCEGKMPYSALAVLAGLLVQNAILSIIGFIAQFGDIRSPSRWAVELLHVVWMVGAANMLVDSRAG